MGGVEKGEAAVRVYCMREECIKKALNPLRRILGIFCTDRVLR